MTIVNTSDSSKHSSSNPINISINKNMNENDMVVYIPYNYIPQITNIDSAVGDINLNKVNNLIINSGVGNIHISEITNKCDINTSVGNITIDKTSIQENSTIETDVGNITIHNSNGVYIDSNDEPKHIDNNTSQPKLTISCLGKITINN